MSKRELVLKAFNNEKIERLPIGFWFHFAQGEEFNQGLTNPEIIRKNIEGHQKYFDEAQPDFLKLMSDGFFKHPTEINGNVENADDLKVIKSVGKDHPWVSEQIKLVKELTGRFNKEVTSFYNVFSPLTYLSLLLGEESVSVVELFHQNPEALSKAVNAIAEDISELAKGVIVEGGADGIYLSVRNFQDPTITKEEYKKYIEPAELKVLEAANAVSENNILHICGYEGSKNDLTTYVEYPAKVINWAVNVENVSLAEGKKLFDGRAVIGGFKNSPGELIQVGSKEEIEQFTKQLLDQFEDTTGVIIGADCTVPGDTPYEHFEWIREAASR